MSRRLGRGWGDGPIKCVPCTQEDLAHTKVLPHKFIIVKNPWRTFQSSVIKITQLKSRCLPIADVDKLVSKVTLNHVILSFHSGWGGGILRLFLLLLGSQCPKSDTWQGSLYLWGLLWSSTANKGYQRVHAAPFPPGYMHIPQQESGRVTNNGSL